jgi:ligand-binding SRPBCC domain-containing protein
MRYKRFFSVAAPLTDVVAFHQQSVSMAEITPPPVRVQIHRAPQILQEGDEMEFTLWLGFIPIHWLARIEDTSPSGFTDREIAGPFESWIHKHSFHPIDSGTTLIQDEIQFKLHKHPLWGLIGLGMGLSLPFLFMYRAWQTRIILSHRTPIPHSG